MSRFMNKKNKSMYHGIYAAFVDNESALKRFLGRFLYSPEDVDDMAQETFLRAYRGYRGTRNRFPQGLPVQGGAHHGV